MTYKELANKLNEKYNTDIFSCNYDFEITEDKICHIDVKIEGLKKAFVSANIETLELTDFCCFGLINPETLVRLAKAPETYQEIQKYKDTVNMLKTQIEFVSTDLAKIPVLEGVRDFAQDTLLKAIKGQQKNTQF